MTEELEQMPRNIRSIVWGFIVYIIGGVLSYLIPLPFVGLIFLGLIYFGYLKKRGIHIGYFLLGYFAILIIVLVLFAGLLGVVIVGGLI